METIRITIVIMTVKRNSTQIGLWMTSGNSSGKISLDAVAGHWGGDAERPLGGAALTFAADQKPDESLAPLWKQAEEGDDRWVIIDGILYRKPHREVVRSTISC